MFAPVNCSDTSCNRTVYASNDPKLCSSGHSGQRIVLDKPPTNGDLFTTKGLDPSIEYSASSTGYSDNTYMNLKKGSITYYYDTQLSTPFIPQLFDLDHRIVKETYIDPMGVCKPHYIYIPTTLGSPTASPPPCTTGCPVWLRDSQLHREDLMSKQLAKTNQNNYEVNLAMSGDLCVCKKF
jgi:hypothetical protein